MTTEALTRRALAEEPAPLNVQARLIHDPEGRAGPECDGSHKPVAPGPDRAYGQGMGEIINLRLARKARSRQQAEQTASENRARHGRTGSERARDRTEAERAARLIDGARRDGPDALPEVRD